MIRLKPKGFEVLMASNGLMAWRWLLPEEPDLMIVDQQMPRLTGLEVLKSCRNAADSSHSGNSVWFRRNAVQVFRLGFAITSSKPSTPMK
ncbi:MAG: response regulator [Ardenticatenaceae bacterium]|nr:response regulator [Ardenticatenaceae bacterium]